MTEQEIIATPNESSPTSTSAQKPAQKSKSPNKAVAKPTKKTSAKTSTQTDEQKRLARNAALREWRLRNKDRYAAYMADWRAKRKGDAPAVVIPASGAQKTSKKSISKKSKKEGKA